MGMLRGLLCLFFVLPLGAFSALEAHPGRHYVRPKPSPANHHGSGYHQHDGFFMRFTGGPAQAESMGSFSEGDANIPMGIGGFAIGSSLSSSWSLHFSIVGSGVSDPNTPVWQRPHGARDHAIVGFGLTYHLMPSNVYFSFSSGHAVHTIDRVERSGNVLPEDRRPEHLWDGYGYSASVGKEWWLSANWSLGIAFQALMIESSEGRFTSSGPVLSVTYN